MVNMATRIVKILLNAPTKKQIHYISLFNKEYFMNLFTC